MLSRKILLFKHQGSSIIFCLESSYTLFRLKSNIFQFYFLGIVDKISCIYMYSIINQISKNISNGWLLKYFIKKESNDMNTCRPTINYYRFYQIRNEIFSDERQCLFVIVSFWLHKFNLSLVGNCLILSNSVLSGKL